PFAVRSMDELTHYEMLEIEPSAADEEIRRAYRRVRELYGHDSLVISGLYNRDRLSALHLRIDEAYETLIDEERRRAYDLAIFPDGQAPRRRSGTPVGVPIIERSAPISQPLEPVMPDTAPVPKQPLPPEPLIGPATEFTGG